MSASRRGRARTARLLALGSVLSFAILAASAPARAATDEATAEALFKEARGRMARGDFAAACPQLEESQRLDPGMGTLYNLADCYENMGRTASAWASFLDVAAQAKAQAQAGREADARARAAALFPKLAHLTLVVQSADAKTTRLKITRDELEVGEAQWGLVLPIDPGQHLVTATAPGRKAWSSVVKVAPSASARLDVPALAVDAPPPPDVKPPEPRPSATQRSAGFVTMGVGVAALAVGSIAGLQSMSKKSDADKNCTGDLCNAKGVSDRDAALTAGNVSTVSFVVGGAAVVGGVLLVLFAPKARPAAPRTALCIAPTASGIGGTFW